MPHFIRKIWIRRTLDDDPSALLGRQQEGNQGAYFIRQRGPNDKYFEAVYKAIVDLGIHVKTKIKCDEESNRATLIESDKWENLHKDGYLHVVDHSFDPDILQPTDNEDYLREDRDFRFFLYRRVGVLGDHLIATLDNDRISVFDENDIVHIPFGSQVTHEGRADVLNTLCTNRMSIVNETFGGQYSVKVILNPFNDMDPTIDELANNPKLKIERHYMTPKQD
tara:strand:+ start:118 stop:786 length:669 start_codon:yes stop_codon:yes gene_type:complete